MKILILTTAYLSLLIVSQAYAENPEHVLLSSKGIGATVVSKTRINSSDSRAFLKITESDAAEYCDRDPGGETKKHNGKFTLRQCIKHYLQATATDSFQISAICHAKTITSSFREGNPFIYTRKKIDGEYSFVWISKLDGSYRDGTTAGQGDALTSQYNALCPAYALR